MKREGIFFLNSFLFGESIVSFRRGESLCSTALIAWLAKGPPHIYYRCLLIFIFVSIQLFFPFLPTSFCCLAVSLSPVPNFCLVYALHVELMTRATRPLRRGRAGAMKFYLKWFLEFPSFRRCFFFLFDIFFFFFFRSRRWETGSCEMMEVEPTPGKKKEISSLPFSSLFYSYI